MKLRVLNNANATPQKHRVAFFFSASPTIQDQLDQHYRFKGRTAKPVGYSVKAVINGSPLPEQILPPDAGKVELDLVIGDQVLLFVMPIDRDGTYGQGRPFEFRFQGKRLPAPVGEIRMGTVTPLVVEPDDVERSAQAVAGADQILGFSVSDAGTGNVPPQPPTPKEAEMPVFHMPPWGSVPKG